jgi:hypothetical protein
MAKVTDLRVGLRSFDTVFVITKSVAKEVGKQAVPQVRREIERRATGLYKDVMLNLRNKLKFSGMLGQNVTVDGPRQLTYLKLGGGSGRLRTQPWSALKEPYRDRKPRSKRFWYKTGTLAASFARLASRSPKVQTQELKASRSHHKGRINTKFILTFSRLSYHLERLKIRQSFIAGKRVSYDDRSVKWRQGLGRAIVPESTRPWMRDMAAALGRDLRKNLRKI